MENPVEKYGRKHVAIAIVLAAIVIGLLLYFGNDVHAPYNQ